MRVPLTIALTFAYLLAAKSPARADDKAASGSGLCRPSSPERCFETNARELRGRGRTTDAIALLKAGIESHADSAVLTLLLAQSYLDEHNDMWALRVLSGYFENHPNDCEVASWMASLYLKQGSLDEARQLLEPAPCWQRPPLQARRLLLLSLAEQTAKKSDTAQDHLQTAYRSTRAFSEDREAIARLTSREPGFLPPLSVRFDLALGFATNARAGSPTDEALTGADANSPVGQLNGWARWVHPTGRLLRPALELDARALGYSSQTGRDLSYVLMGGRPGVIIGWYPSVLVAYRFESFLLAEGDRYQKGPLWFYNAHRGEFESDILSPLTLFGGAGRRLFRESGRSRTEVDGGIGGSLAMGSAASVMGVVTGRWYGADKDPYDMQGGSLLLNAEYRLPYRWTLRAGAIVGLDYYPDSKGYFDANDPDTHRKDVLFKLSASGFSSTVLESVRFGLAYEFANRFSTASPYDYQDHRVLIKVQYNLALDPWLPRAVSPAHHVAMQYDIDSAEFQERVQDLLRQDEAAQRSSSCVN